MPRHLLLSFFTMAVPGVVIRACARPSPPPVSSTAASATSAAPATSTSTSVPGRYCPWCSLDIPIDNDKRNCKLFVQPPENYTTTIIDYPVLLFNNDLTQLVKADFISPYVPTITWYLNPSPEIRSTGLHVVLMPLSPPKGDISGIA
jgi:hypothetical protein